MSLRRNTLWNMIGAAVPFLLGLATIPYLLKQVGEEAFGVLSLIWTMIGYFSIFDFGLGRALTQQVASNRAAGIVKELPGLVKTGLVFTLVAGVVGGLLLAILANPLGLKWLNVSPGLKSPTIQALLIASIGIPLTTLTTGLKGVLEAFEEFKSANILRIILGLANFGLPALTVKFFGPSLALMVYSLILTRLVMLLAHFYLVYKLLPHGWIKAQFSKEKLIGLLSFGSWMTLSNVVSPLMVVADRFIISSIVGASSVAFYVVPADTLIRVLIIPAALSTALFPRLATTMVTDPIASKVIYGKCLKTVLFIMLPICLGIVIFSHFGLTLWLGADFAEKSWKIASILALGIMMNGVAQVPYAAVQAAANAKATALLHVGEFVFYLPLLFVFLHYFGLIGAAIVWVIRVGVDMLILLFFAKKAFNSLIIEKVLV